MAISRTGQRAGFWNNDGASVGAASTVQAIPEGMETICIWLNVSAATTITVEVASDVDITAEGIESDFVAGSGNWAPLFYNDIEVKATFTSAGIRAIIIPDFCPRYIRLKTSSAATITAGWEALGET